MLHVELIRAGSVTAAVAQATPPPPYHLLAEAKTELY
jgi:hypothetical protein